jgi:hypothetical protein
LSADVVFIKPNLLAQPRGADAKPSLARPNQSGSSVPFA